MILQSFKRRNLVVSERKVVTYRRRNERGTTAINADHGITSCSAVLARDLNHPFGPFALLPIHVHTLSSPALSHLSPNRSFFPPESGCLTYVKLSLHSPSRAHLYHHRIDLPLLLKLSPSPSPIDAPDSPVSRTSPVHARLRTLCVSLDHLLHPLDRPGSFLTPPAPFNDAPSPRQMTRVLDQLGRVRAPLAPPVPPIPHRDDDAGLVRPRRKMAASSKIGVSDVRAGGSCGRFAPSFLPFPCC